MTLTDTHKAVMAAVGLLALGAGSVGVFQTRAAADEAKKEVEQKQAKTVAELRAEMYLNRIKALNDKAKLTKDEQDEKELLLATVKAIKSEQAEKAAK